MKTENRLREPVTGFLPNECAEQRLAKASVTPLRSTRNLATGLTHKYSLIDFYLTHKKKC